MTSIYMLKILGNSIYKPIQIIFRSYIESGKFPFEWKKADIVPVHKKRNGQTLENCRPVSLHPFYDKFLNV